MYKPSVSELWEGDLDIVQHVHGFSLSVSSAKLLETKEALEKDIQVQEVKRTTVAGWPEDKSQAKILSMFRCKTYLRWVQEYVYWPRMHTQLCSLIERCYICQSCGNCQHKETVTT